MANSNYDELEGMVFLFARLWGSSILGNRCTHSQNFRVHVDFECCEIFLYKMALGCVTDKEKRKRNSNDVSNNLEFTALLWR